jgi:RNase H-fold protein (predicted Holliday junction resolvase)
MVHGKSVVMALFAGAAVLYAFGAPVRPIQAQSQPPADKAGQAPEVKTLLSGLVVDKARVYKNMLVFPIRYEGPQAPGNWETMDKAVQAGHLKILEKAQAQVSEVQMENVGDATVFLMSGEIIKGGQQTRVIRQDTVIEAKQKASVPVFCVEPHRWTGKREFESSRNLAPVSVRRAIQDGAGQSEVWARAAERSDALNAPNATGNLDESLNSEQAQRDFGEAHKALGRFSPPETIGIAVADARTGRVVGLEVFGRRDLFENLQDKLVEGYAVDLVLAVGAPASDSKLAVGEKEVAEFIQRALAGSSQYERTPGSGRGVDLTSGALRGKGVSAGEMLIHLSVQESHLLAMPAKPIVDDGPVMYDNPAPNPVQRPPAPGPYR